MTKKTEQLSKSLIGTVKGLVIKVIVKQAMTGLLTKLPFLSLGPLGWITSFLITRFVEFLTDKTILGATLLYIDISNDGKVKAVEKATEKINDAKKQGATNEEIERLDKELAKVGRDLIKFGHLT